VLALMMPVRLRNRGKKNQPLLLHRFVHAILLKRAVARKSSFERNFVL